MVLVPSGGVAQSSVKQRRGRPVNNVESPETSLDSTGDRRVFHSTVILPAVLLLFCLV